MVTIIAHRGARSLAPENTLVAARKAHQLGADLWETDTAITADGQIVLMHDDAMMRTTDVAEKFPEIRAGLRPVGGRDRLPRVGQRIDDTDEFGPRRIPILLGVEAAEVAGPDDGDAQWRRSPASIDQDRRSRFQRLRRRYASRFWRMAPP